jgi:hypothetical protein
MRQRRLVSILVEDVELPNKFHRLQPVDLSQWRDDGSPAPVALSDAVDQRIGPPRGEDEPLDAPPVESPIAAARLQTLNAVRPLAARVGITGPRGAIIAGVLVLVLAAIVAVVAGRQMLARRAAVKNHAPAAASAAPAPVAQAIKDYTAPTEGAPDAQENERGWTKDDSGCRVANPSPRPKETMTWSGACVHGKAYGPGVVEWSENGQKRSSVRAQWRDGKPIETITVHDYATDETYEGVQEDGQWIGKVVVTARWGKIEGPIANGAITGYGTLTAANGRRYEGGFIDNKFNGKGVLTEPDGTRYVGDFVAGLFDGKGTLTWPDQSHYEGEFSKGQRTGKGLFVDAIGDRYAGDFVGGKFDGQGVLTTKKGERHEGKFVAGQFVR